MIVYNITNKSIIIVADWNKNPDELQPAIINNQFMIEPKQAIELDVIGLSPKPVYYEVLNALDDAAKIIWNSCNDGFMNDLHCDAAKAWLRTNCNEPFSHGDIEKYLNDYTVKILNGEQNEKK